MSEKLSLIVEQAKGYIPEMPDSLDDLTPARAIIWWAIVVGCIIVGIAVVAEIFN